MNRMLAIGWCRRSLPTSLTTNTIRANARLAGRNAAMPSSISLITATSPPLLAPGALKLTSEPRSNSRLSPLTDFADDHPTDKPDHDEPKEARDEVGASHTVLPSYRV
jgi:hypothetical protein